MVALRGRAAAALSLAAPVRFALHDKRKDRHDHHHHHHDRDDDIDCKGQGFFGSVRVTRPTNREIQMSYRSIMLAAALCALPSASFAHDRDDDDNDKRSINVQLGPRPFYLVDRMRPGPLKDAPREMHGRAVPDAPISPSGTAAPRCSSRSTPRSPTRPRRVMGAGIVECDVTFTSDGDLVCRHAENDLHTTTNILVTPLAATCIRPFTPASVDASGKPVTPASAECRTSDAHARGVQEPEGQDGCVQPGGANGRRSSWAAPLRGAPTSTPGRGTLVTLRESIELNKRNGVKHTPELKSGDAATIAKVFGSQEKYAQELADVLQDAGRQTRTMRGRSRST